MFEWIKRLFRRPKTPPGTAGRPGTSSRQVVGSASAKPRSVSKQKPETFQPAPVKGPPTKQGRAVVIPSDLRATKQTKAKSEAARPSKTIKYITVGIDFGTSSTKVVFGDLNTRKHYLLRFSGSSLGQPDFILPSVVQIVTGVAHFGWVAALSGSGGQSFHSFKMCLACQYRLAECRRCEHRQGEHDRGVFRVLADGENVAISAHQLATWYLAYVIALCREEIGRLWGQAAEVRVLFNIGAPIDQHNLSLGKEAFEKAAYWAEKLSNRVRDGASVRDLLDAYEQVSTAHSSVPSEGEKITFIQPETAAGLMSYVNSPHSEEGLYGIVDVGAGTTDVSFFRLADIQRDQPRLMAFYDAATEVIGSDEIDRAIATLAIRRAGLPQQTPRLAALLAASKSAKEQLDQKPNVRVSLNGSSVTLSRTEVAASAASIIDKMAGNYVETNRRSYRKEPLVGRWASFTVFFLGGGTRLKMIEEKLRRTRPSPYNHTINYKRIPVPQDLELLADAKSNFDLVAVAYGLSFPPLDFPNILNPSQVGPISFNLRCDSRPDRDELYPK